MKLRYLLPLLLIFSCGKVDNRKTTLNENILSECNTAIQNAIVVDNIAAPLGSRRYYYACVAAYESLIPFHNDYLSLAHQLRGLKPMFEPDTSKGYCLDMVAMCAHTYVSQKLVYKEDSIKNFRKRKLDWYKEKLNSGVFKNSMAWGDSVGAHIVRWAVMDSFLQTRGTNLYLVKNEPGFWQPTLPDYKDALEPNWNKVRTAVAPGPAFISIKAPEPYSRNKNSRFYKLCEEVYKQVNSQDSSKLHIANYWDDNPNSFIHVGHATFSVLKVSPSGHWLGIFSTVAKQKKYNLVQSAEGFARLSAVLLDAFIVCWDTKYKTEYIRPETAIRDLIDSTWLPPIQTPSFPEYPSGHSVVSSAAATVLTSMFGEYSFTDSTENEFGLGIRKFKNFREAANEACMSRLYGGIHFIDGIEYGKEMGNKLGEYHIGQISTRKKE
jgi:hypothetical protein